MHILVLPSWYPRPDDPINGSFFREQAMAMAAFGHRVTVFAVRTDFAGSYTEKKTEGNFAEYILHVKPLKLHLTYFRVVAEMSRIIRREMAGDRPDVIHVHSFRCGRYARALKLLFRIPYVVTEHFSGFLFGSFSKRTLREAHGIFSRAAAVTAVSGGLRDAMRSCYEGPIEVIPNMVSENFLTAGLHVPPDGGEFRFLSVGNMGENKGFDALLRAFAKAAADRPHLRLTLVGGGDGSERYLALARELGVEDKVVFTGRISREEVSAQMHRAHAFILLSRKETFGVVFLEAMAAGLPVIMTKTCAWDTIVSPACGIAVDVDDVDAAAAAMAHVAEHYEEYDPGTISRRCRELFSAEAVCVRYTECLTRARGKK